MKKLSLARAFAYLVFTFSLAVCAHAQTLNYFADLSAGNGWEPYASVVQGTDGNFYSAGTGGIYGGGGNMFRMTPDGKVSSLYEFCSLPNCADGGFVTSAPLVGTDGNLYGVTYGGGPGSFGSGGVVYRMTLNGELTVLYPFCSRSDCADGATPNGIILGSDGNFYGTTVYGGVNNDGPGVIFKVTPDGGYTLLYSFCSKTNCTDGNKPFYPPVEGNDGNLYGSTTSGGTLGGGVIYKLTSSGNYSVLYNFCGPGGNCTDGSGPWAIAKDVDGNFVGTAGGGTGGYGVVFKITPGGQYSVVHNFAANDLGVPGTPLILGSDGNLYGTLMGSGSGSFGPVTRGGIYEITAKGGFKALYGFCRWCSGNGFNLLDPLFQGTDGNFYGTTAYGGVGGVHGEAIGFGTVFQFSNGLSPFVKTIPAAAKVGTSVLILGYGLTGTSSVTFNGVPAIFTVESDTYIRATVPAGATTGKVSVVTASSGTLNSSPQFLVTK